MVMIMHLMDGQYECPECGRLDEDLGTFDKHRRTHESNDGRRGQDRRGTDREDSRDRRGRRSYSHAKTSRTGSPLRAGRGHGGSVDRHRTIGNEKYGGLDKTVKPDGRKLDTESSHHREHKASRGSSNAAEGRNADTKATKIATNNRAITTTTAGPDVGLNQQKTMTTIRKGDSDLGNAPAVSVSFLPDDRTVVDPSTAEEAGTEMDHANAAGQTNHPSKPRGPKDDGNTNRGSGSR